MLRVHRLALAAAVLVGIAKPASSQTAEAAANARRAATRIGTAVLAYRAARMELIGDTSKVRLCDARFRSAVPLDTTGPARVAETVGAHQRESCDEPVARVVGQVVVVIDSVHLTLNEATVYSHVRRGESMHREVARLRVPFGATNGHWSVLVVEIGSPIRMTGGPPGL